MFFRPVETAAAGADDDSEGEGELFSLCVQCGEIRRQGTQLACGHGQSIVVEMQEAAQEREDQIPKCSACRYQAPDPVREVVHGTDGPHAVVATNLFQSMPPDRRKILAFADGRQEAAFFAWYLEKSYRDILNRNLLLKAARELTAHSPDGCSLRDIASRLKNAFQNEGVLPATATALELRKEAWLWLYREFLTDEPRISLEGVGLVQWRIQLPPWFAVPGFLRNVPPESFNYAQRAGRTGRRSGYPGFVITYCKRGPHDLYHFARPERMLNGQIRPPVLNLRNVKVITRHIAAVAFSAFFRAFSDRFRNVQTILKDLANPSGVDDFKTFLRERQLQLEKVLLDIVPPEMWQKVGLKDGQWIERVAGSISQAFENTPLIEESRFVLAEQEIASDYRNVLNLEQSAVARQDYRMAEWAKRRAYTIAREDVLSFLSRKAVIPKYGFPVDVVELDTQTSQQSAEASEVHFQRDLSIAIAEFAPTSKLIANKLEWTSSGLKKVAEKEWPRRFYKRCVHDNVFLHWKEGETEKETPCSHALAVGSYLIPQFGFVADRAKPKPPRARPARVFTTRPYFAGSLGSERGEISLPASKPLIRLAVC
jgi:hypothetical protein